MERSAGGSASGDGFEAGGVLRREDVAHGDRDGGEMALRSSRAWPPRVTERTRWAV